MLLPHLKMHSLLKKHGYSDDNYYALGLSLGLLPSTLDLIEADNKGDVSRCLRECLKAWFKSNSISNLEDKLIKALRKIGENTVADGIERETKGSFESPFFRPPIKRHTVQPTELNISHFIDVLGLLKEHGYSSINYYDLGLHLGLHPSTLDVITANNKGDVNSCLVECLKAWLQQRDNVKSRGHPTYDTLIQTLRKMKEIAVADGIERDINSEQLYDVMSSMSHSLPGYIIDHYVRLLAIIIVRSDMKPDWPLSKRFFELYSTHASETSPQVAATYVYKILTGLGYEEMDEHNFSVYLHIELEIDTRITEELEKITKFRPAVIEVVRELDPQLRDYQKDQYRMVLTVLRAAVFDSDKSFYEYFSDLAEKLGKYPLAVAFTIGVLERYGWGDTKKLKPFSLPKFDLNTTYPEVDLCLTVADYYGNMNERDFSSAKVFTSAVHLNNHDVTNMSRIEFTLLLIEHGVVKVGDVSKIEDKKRYLIFFKEYKERCKVQPGFLTQVGTQVKNLQQVQGSSDITQTDTAAAIPDDTTLSTEEKVPAPILSHELFPELNDLQFDSEFPNFPDDLIKDINILLMTATENELRGVLGYLNPLGGRNKIIKLLIKSTWVYIGMYGKHTVVVGMSADGKDEQGGLDASATAQDIMEKFKLNYIIAIGICFGMDPTKVNLGDVIVSRNIKDLSTFRLESDDLESRKFDILVGDRLSGIFSDRTHGFKKKHSDEENAEEVRVHDGPIVCSPVLVNDEGFKKKLISKYPDLLAGEMEGAGIHFAAKRDDCRPEFIVIKSVADWGDGKKEEYRGWKEFASHTAAAYVHHQLNNASVATALK